MDKSARSEDTSWPPGYLPQEEVRLRWSALGGVPRVIGSSVEGRPIETWDWTLAGSAEANHHTGILLLALVHPMEWVGQLAQLALVEDLVQGGVAIPNAARLRVLPIANPDGVARVEQALRSGRARWTRGNTRGVDLNRNFSVHHRCRPRWMDAFPMWCPGPGPASEPETSAIEAWARAEAFDVAISFHSFGRWIFHAPAHTRERDAVSQQHAMVLTRRDWLPYRTAPLGRWSWWFRAFGTEIDFLSSPLGSPRREERARALAYLIEVSRGGIFRWGARRALSPFHWFNPPDPEAELAVLRPKMLALIENSLLIRSAMQ